jgi:hypothetical protein
VRLLRLLPRITLRAKDPRAPDRQPRSVEKLLPAHSIGQDRIRPNGNSAGRAGMGGRGSIMCELSWRGKYVHLFRFLFRPELFLINDGAGGLAVTLRPPRFQLVEHRLHIHEAFALIAQALRYDAVVESDIGSATAYLPDFE